MKSKIAEFQSVLSLEAFLQGPETRPYTEYVNGQVIQKPMPQGAHSLLQIRLGMAINGVGLPQKLAYGFTELRCTFGGRSVVPDLCIFRWDRIPRTPEGRIANRVERVPDWVVEILSPDQSPNQVMEKVIFCLRQGGELGWLIDPQDESVMILQGDRLPVIQTGPDPLTVLPCLPQLQLSAQELFSWLNP